MNRKTNGSTRRLLAGIGVTAALLVPLAVFGAPALAKSAASASEYEYSSGSQYQYKVTICHLTGSKKHPAHTISVAAAAVKAHLRHGDHLGACTGTELPRPHGHGRQWTGASTHGHHHGKPSTGAGTTEHGKGEGHGASSGAPTTSGAEHGNGNAGGNGNGHHH